MKPMSWNQVFKFSERNQILSSVGQTSSCLFPSPQSDNVMHMFAMEMEVVHSIVGTVSTTAPFLGKHFL